MRIGGFKENLEELTDEDFYPAADDRVILAKSDFQLIRSHILAAVQLQEILICEYLIREDTKILQVRGLPRNRSVLQRPLE